MPADADRLTLGAPGSGGMYVIPTGHIELAVRLPDEFPDVEFGAASDGEIDRWATVIEEFAHRFQFHLTQFGLLYRLCGLTQSLIALRLLRAMGEETALSLPTPWINLRSGDAEIDDVLEDLRALESTKRLLLGTLPLDEGADLARAKEALVTPWPLGHFGGPWGREELFEGGVLQYERTTCGIAESHASGYALLVLDAATAGAHRERIDGRAATSRTGIYRSVERIAAALPARFSDRVGLEAVVRYGSVGLDGKFFEIRCVPPSDDYVEAAFPFNRYRMSLDRLEGLERASRTADMALDLDTIVGLGADYYSDRARLSMLDIEFDADAYRACYESQLPEVHGWRMSVLEGVDHVLEQIVLNFIADAADTYLRGLILAPDRDFFVPATARFRELCALCDHPSVRYGDELEVFLCEPSHEPDYWLRYSTTALRIALMTDALVRVGWGNLGRIFNGVAAADRMATSDLLDFYGVQEARLA